MSSRDALPAALSPGSLGAPESEVRVSSRDALPGALSPGSARLTDAALAKAERWRSRSGNACAEAAGDGAGEGRLGAGASAPSDAAVARSMLSRKLASAALLSRYEASYDR